MRFIRTDMAMESLDGVSGESGIKVNTWETSGVSVTEIIVETDEISGKINKPKGRYVTIACSGLIRHDVDSRMATANVLSEELGRMINVENGKTVLVAGLGNREITPDSLGPTSVESVLVTRHVFQELSSYLDEKMNSVSAIAPGVLGVTGIETFEILSSVVERINPSCVICIDALASRSIDRVLTTIQLTDAGIQPGSGVGNRRLSITKETLGVPVIAIGVPTVITASAIARDAFFALTKGEESEDALDRLESELSEGAIGEMIVTPRGIDGYIKDISTVIASGVNRALQPELSEEEILSMMS